jgi:hypothetical protein
VQAGKLGGEPFRFDLNFSHISPTLDLNGAGFLPTQNQQDLVGGTGNSTCTAQCVTG